MVELGERDGADRFEGVGGAQDESVGVAGADEVEADGEAGVGKAARDGGGGLAGKVERVGVEDLGRADLFSLRGDLDEAGISFASAYARRSATQGLAASVRRRSFSASSRV